jgi:hypothetical protein
MGIEGTGSPSVSMRLGDDHVDRQKHAKQFNEEMNQAKETADDDVSSSETAPQRKAIGGFPTTQSLVDSGPRQFTDEQIYGETKAASERIDKQIEEDRRNSLQPATGQARSVFPEPGRKGWAVHAESPPRVGLGGGTCNVSASELNRRGIIRDPIGMGFDLRLVRSADTGVVRLEAFNPDTPGYYDAPDPGLLDFRKPSPSNVEPPPSMSSNGQSSYKEIMPGSSSWFPPPPLRPGSLEEYQAKLESAQAGIGINAPLIIVSEIFGGNSQAMIEQSVPANGVLNALGGTYQDAAVQPTLTSSGPTVSTTISSLEANAPTPPRPTTTVSAKTTSSANPSTQTPASAPPSATPTAPPATPAKPTAVPPTATGSGPPPAVGGGSSAPGPAGPLGGGMRVTVKREVTILDTEGLISLDKVNQPNVNPPPSPKEQAVANAARNRPIAATPTAVGQFNAAGERGTVPVTRLVPHTPKERQDIIDELQRAGVGGKNAKGDADRAIVAEALLTQREPNVVPVFQPSDNGVINGLARAAKMDPARLSGYNVTEYLHYKLGVAEFTVTIKGRSLIVRPFQEIRPRGPQQR